MSFIKNPNGNNITAIQSRTVPNWFYPERTVLITSTVTPSHERYTNISADDIIEVDVSKWTWSWCIVDDVHITSETYAKLFYLLRYWISINKHKNLVLVSKCMDWQCIYHYFGKSINVQNHLDIRGGIDIWYMNDVSDLSDTGYSMYYRYNLIPSIIYKYLTTRTETQLLGIVYLSSIRQCKEISDILNRDLQHFKVDNVLIRTNLKSLPSTLKGRTMILTVYTVMDSISADLVIDTGMVYTPISSAETEFGPYSKGMAYQRLQCLSPSGTLIRTLFSDEFTGLASYTPIYFDVERFIIELEKKNLPVDTILFDINTDHFKLNLAKHGLIHTTSHKLTDLGKFAASVHDITNDTSKLIWDNVVRTCDKSAQRALLRTFSYIIIDAIQKYGSIVRINKHTNERIINNTFLGVDELHTYLNIFVTLFHTKQSSIRFMKSYSIDPYVTGKILTLIQQVIESKSLHMLLPKAFDKTVLQSTKDKSIFHVKDSVYDCVKDTILKDTNWQWLDDTCIYDPYTY